MKKLLKIMAVLATVAALGFGFVSCSSGDGDGSGSVAGAVSAGGSGGTGASVDSSLAEKAVAVYTHTFKGVKDGDNRDETIHFYFNKDNTFLMHMYLKITTNIMSVDMECITDVDICTGTYEGDPTKDGTVKIVQQKKIDQKAAKDLAETECKKEFIKKLSMGNSNSKVSVKLTNAECPLNTINPNNETLTISGGKFTLKEDDENEEYVKKP